jgi:glycosyltransferase involved in cell wall biosynthesis
VNNEAFFKAAALVLQSRPETRFLCTGMENEPQALRWVKSLGIASQCELLPQQTRHEMAGLFRRSRIMVSPSNHDGTPNTLLEAMACGCLPVAGDLESVREWITHTENGILVNPNDPQDLAQALLRGLDDDNLREHAQMINTRLIAERAEYTAVMKQVENFYQLLIE